MNWLASTLWDLLRPQQRSPARPRGNRRSIVPAGEPVAQSVKRRVAGSTTAQIVPQAKRTRKAGMQDRYDALVEEMKARYNVRVRKWRRSSSGVAWQIRYHSGQTVRLIESPYPRGPMSCAIFLHEIGHHAIGLGVHRPRCLEEYHVWVWALREMRERGFNVTPAVEKRFHDSMRYAVRKARRRGLTEIPLELIAYSSP